MFGQTTAVLVALSARLALEVAGARLLLSQDGAITATASLDLLIVRILITLGQAVGGRGVACLTQGAETGAR